VVAKPERIADMIQHHRSLARLRAQAPTNHLQVQPTLAVGRSRMQPPTLGHVNAFTYKCATGEHL
jgi:hypothetical protein